MKKAWIYQPWAIYASLAVVALTGVQVFLDANWVMVNHFFSLYWATYWATSLWQAWKSNQAVKRSEQELREMWEERARDLLHNILDENGEPVFNQVQLSIQFGGVSAEEAVRALKARQHLGRPDCKYNARSPHLRCAVNPSGPCDGCSDFEPSMERSR